ncbi:hypothetical protein B0H13DRAFT_2430340 [Mycena leptocephala]|nr:hypothetical protein B0H13DRAFT_2430340 [Mycena leptocephala]
MSQRLRQYQQTLRGLSAMEKKAEARATARRNAPRDFLHPGANIASSACEKKDGPTHKKACGKMDFDPESTAPSRSPPTSSSDVLEQTPLSFARRRSGGRFGTLTNRTSDYHFDAQPGHTDSIVVGYPPGGKPSNKTCDGICLKRDWPSSSRAVGRWHRALSSDLQDARDSGARGGHRSTKLHEARYRRQFEKEYRIKMTPEGGRTAGAFVSPTTQELEEEERFLRERWDRVENHPQRPPLPRTL